jgi:peptidyl-prolyl cis-trans isomerase B (cyclophilin B)
VQNPEACRHLNGSYTVFGQVIQGLDVIDKIAGQPVQGRNNVPKEPIRISLETKTLSKKKIAQIYGTEMLFSE